MSIMSRFLLHFSADNRIGLEEYEMINDNLIDAIIKFKSDNYSHSMNILEKQEELKNHLNYQYEELKFVLSQLYDDDGIVYSGDFMYDVWWDSKSQDLLVVKQILNDGYFEKMTNLKYTRNIMFRLINVLRKQFIKTENLMFGLIVFNVFLICLGYTFKFPHKAIKISDLINDSKGMEDAQTIFYEVGRNLPREIRDTLTYS